MGITKEAHDSCHLHSLSQSLGFFSARQKGNNDLMRAFSLAAEYCTFVIVFKLLFVCVK
jgi:hypothetical protein